jgi:hypothetical protein
MGSFFVQGCTYTQRARCAASTWIWPWMVCIQKMQEQFSVCRSSICTGMYLYPKGTLCCDHMDMARDGLYSENAGAIFCVQEQNLYRDVLIPKGHAVLRAHGYDQGWFVFRKCRSNFLCAEAVIVQGCTYSQRARCALFFYIGVRVVLLDYSDPSLSDLRSDPSLQAYQTVCRKPGRGLLLAQQIPPTEIRRCRRDLPEGKAPTLKADNKKPALSGFFISVTKPYAKSPG